MLDVNSKVWKRIYRFLKIPLEGMEQNKFEAIGLWVPFTPDLTPDADASMSQSFN